jgi:hypothetical protein
MKSTVWPNPRSAEDAGFGFLSHAGHQRSGASDSGRSAI